MGYRKNVNPKLKGKRARLALYHSLRTRGYSNAQAGKELRVCGATVMNYERDYQTMISGDSLESGAVSSALMVKEELLKRISQLIRDTCTPIQYISSLSREMRELTGWTAPKQLEVADSRVVKPIGELLDRWAAEKRTAGGTPQASSDKKSLRGQLDVTKFGKGESLSPLVSTTCNSRIKKTSPNLEDALNSPEINDLEIEEKQGNDQFSKTAAEPAGTE